MLLTRLEYSEFQGQPSSWSLSATKLGEINLIVGKNSAGKTRFLNLVAALANLLIGTYPTLFQSGHYKAQFQDSGDVLDYELLLDKAAVVQETFARNGKILMNRGLNGAGTIFAEKQGGEMQFQAPPSLVAAHVKRDSLQHSFLEALHKWATGVRQYNFGTSLGREHLLSINDYANEAALATEDPRRKLVGIVHKQAWDLFGVDFDMAIINDMQVLGYDLEAVGVQALELPLPQPIMGVYVKERDLQATTTQLTMSAGMYRALVLVIFLNDCVFRKLSCTLLIDDIGEGLDFTRARGLVELLMRKAKKNPLQLLMTTNDRFVMNNVPLEHWGVIRREGGSVSIINQNNAPEIFDKFQDLGLNNFDFFATGFFEKGNITS